MQAASAHMTKSLALDPHDLSSRGDLLPSRAGIPPRVASIIWNRNFPSLLSDPSTHSIDTSITYLLYSYLYAVRALRDAQLGVRRCGGLGLRDLAQPGAPAAAAGWSDKWPQQGMAFIYTVIRIAIRIVITQTHLFCPA